MRSFAFILRSSSVLNGLKPTSAASRRSAASTGFSLVSFSPKCHPRAMSSSSSIAHSASSLYLSTLTEKVKNERQRDALILKGGRSNLFCDIDVFFLE